MELLCVLAAVAALFCGCAVLTLKCRVPASVAPLTALSAIVAVLTLAAMAGVLYPAAWLLYLLCLAGGVWVAASCRGSTGAAQRLFTPGSVLFWGMALAFTVYFFVQQPMATDFDELSLWATAVKITKVNDSLYATAEREAQFRTAMADMGHQFWTSDGKLSMIGQGRNVVALIAIVFAVAILTAASRRLKARIAVIGALSGVCFLGYNLMLALSYGFIFVPFQAEQLVDYNRYIYSYYIGWFILALGCLSVALLPQITVKGGADGPTAVFAATRRQPHAAFELFVLALACGMLFRQSQLILPQLSVLGFADSEFTDRRAERAEAELVCSYLAPDDRVFYVGQGDNGEGWFSAVFDFYPILVDYSGTVTTDPDTGETKMIGGGGELGLPELQPGEGVKNTYYHAFTAEELDSIVRGNGCTVLYIQTLDDIFVQSYADLFTDKLAAAQSGETLLYRVTDAGFTPMQMEVSAR